MGENECLYHIMYIFNDVSLGGAAQSLLDTLTYIVQRRIKPIVIIPVTSMLEEKLKAMHITYYAVAFERGYGKIGAGTKHDEDRNFWNNYRAAIQLQDIICRENIDLIHINSSVTNVGAFAAMLAGIPYVWHIRELLEEQFACEYWDRELKKRLFASADKIVTISDCVRNHIADKFNVDSVRVYNGVDYKRFVDYEKVEHGDKDNCSFLITGDISEGKGQFDAVQAIKILVDDGNAEVKLTLCGNADQRYTWIIKKYMQLHHLENYITILPFQPDLTTLRREHAYSITTSRLEALGRCTIEAMMAGNFVIGADSGGTSEIIGNQEERGLLYQPGDAEALATAMKKAITMEDAKKSRYLRAAQEYAVHIFDPEVYVANMIRIYRELVECDYMRKEGLASELKARYEALNQDSYQEIHRLAKDNRINRKAIELEAKWDTFQKNGGHLETYFQRNHHEIIAIYGMGKFGCRLYDELTLAGMNIVFVVDQNGKDLSEIMDVKKPEDTLGELDVLVVTVANEEEHLVNEYKRMGYHAVGISRIVDEMLDIMGRPYRN